MKLFCMRISEYGHLGNSSLEPWRSIIRRFAVTLLIISLPGPIGPILGLLVNSRRSVIFYGTYSCNI